MSADEYKPAHGGYPGEIAAQLHGIVARDEAEADIESARKIARDTIDQCTTIPHHAGGTTTVLAADDALEVERRKLGL